MQGSSKITIRLRASHLFSFIPAPCLSLLYSVFRLLTPIPDISLDLWLADVLATGRHQKGTEEEMRGETNVFFSPLSLLVVEHGSPSLASAPSWFRLSVGQPLPLWSSLPLGSSSFQALVTPPTLCVPIVLGEKPLSAIANLWVVSLLPVQLFSSSNLLKLVPCIKFSFSNYLT